MKIISHRRKTTYRALRQRLKLFDMTIDELAKQIGLSRNAINERFMGRVPWTVTEMYRAADALDIKDAEIARFFPRDIRGELS